MRDPKEILTESGYRKYLAGMVNIQESIFYILNHAEDLHMDYNTIDIFSNAADEAARLLNTKLFEKDED